MPTSRPNLLFLLADDLGYGDLSAFNGGLSDTPTLDALVQEGVCFTQQYCASPVCNPSRACLLTGRYPHRTGSIDTLEWWGLERLSLRERTLAEMLQAAGYATGLVGKWHLGAFDPRYHPLRRGFDETVCFRGGMHDYYQWRVEWGETARRTDGRYLTDLWTEEAVQFLERHQREPFFLHVTYNAPHTPLQAPEEDIAPFRDKPGLSRAVSTLYGMIHRMDVGIGRILETLDRLGLRDNTIVVFTSDNGPQFGGAGEDCLDRFNCNFRGAKGHTYEGGIRVPLVARWPDGLPQRREVHDMAHFADWLPTFLEMTGVPLPADHLPLDGVSLLPALRGETGRTVTKRCWQWNRYEPVYECNVAIRDGDWKLVRPWLEGTGPDIVCGQWLWVSMYGPEHFLHNGLIPRPYPPRTLGAPRPPELYNLRDDPYEEHDLVAQRPDLALRLQTELENWADEVERDRRETPEYAESLTP